MLIVLSNMPFMNYQELRGLVGRQIQRRRRELGWNQRELGRRAGVSQRVISNLENSNNAMQFDTLVAVSEALGLKVWDLLRLSAISGVSGQEDKPYDSQAVIPCEQLTSFGLQQLSADRSLTETLAITPDEWRRLAAIGQAMPPTVDKAGYVALLYTLRAIAPEVDRRALGT